VAGSEVESAAERGVEGTQFFTRRQVARRLGLSLSGVRSLENRKKLHGIKRAIRHGAYKFVFREAEVEKLASEFQVVAAQSVPDVRDAKVFDAFAEGKTVVDVVRELRIDSAVVEKLWLRFARYSPNVARESDRADDEDLHRQMERDAARPLAPLHFGDELRRGRDRHLKANRARREGGT
jgi:hypothetical protein